MSYILVVLKRLVLCRYWRISWYGLSKTLDLGVPLSCKHSYSLNLVSLQVIWILIGCHGNNISGLFIIVTPLHHHANCYACILFICYYVRPWPGKDPPLVERVFLPFLICVMVQFPHVLIIGVFHFSYRHACL